VQLGCGQTCRRHNTQPPRGCQRHKNHNATVLDPPRHCPDSSQELRGGRSPTIPRQHRHLEGITGKPLMRQTRLSLSLSRSLLSLTRTYTHKHQPTDSEVPSDSIEWLPLRNGNREVSSLRKALFRTVVSLFRAAAIAFSFLERSWDGSCEYFSSISKFLSDWSSRLSWLLVSLDIGQMPGTRLSLVGPATLGSGALGSSSMESSCPARFR
jgi:hypothetical protein